MNRRDTNWIKSHEFYVCDVEQQSFFLCVTLLELMWKPKEEKEKSSQNSKFKKIKFLFLKLKIFLKLFPSLFFFKKITYLEIYYKDQISRVLSQMIYFFSGIAFEIKSNPKRTSVILEKVQTLERAGTSHKSMKANTCNAINFVPNASPMSSCLPL